MPITTLPPSPAGELLHNDVREKINEVIDESNLQETAIGQNASDIGTNASDISDNVADIATNISDIGDLQVAVAELQEAVIFSHIVVRDTTGGLVPTVETQVGLDTVDNTNGSTAFTDNGDGTITFNATGLYSVVATPNVTKSGTGSTGQYLLGLAVGGVVPKGSWRKFKPSESGAGDEQTPALAGNIVIGAGAVISLRHLNSGSGDISLTDDARNFPLSATISYLGMVEAPPEATALTNIQVP